MFKITDLKDQLHFSQLNFSYKFYILWYCAGNSEYFCSGTPKHTLYAPKAAASFYHPDFPYLLWNK